MDADGIPEKVRKAAGHRGGIGICGGCTKHRRDDACVADALASRRARKRTSEAAWPASRGEWVIVAGPSFVGGKNARSRYRCDAGSEGPSPGPSVWRPAGTRTGEMRPGRLQVEERARGEVRRATARLNLAASPATTIFILPRRRSDRAADVAQRCYLHQWPRKKCWALAARYALSRPAIGASGLRSPAGFDRSD